MLFGAIGASLGALSAATTRVWRNDHQEIMAQAGLWAVMMWVLGMGFRLFFAVYASSRDGTKFIENYSFQHHITSGQAWTTALVLMAILEVLARVGFLQWRRIRLRESRIVSPTLAYPRGN